MTQVVEALTRQPRLFKQILQALVHVWAIQRCPIAGAEDQPPVLLLIPRQEPLFELPSSLSAERGHGHSRQRDRAPAALGFGLDKRRLAVDPLERLPLEGLAVAVGTQRGDKCCWKR